MQKSIAIVGIATTFGRTDSLACFERRLYEGDFPATEHALEPGGKRSAEERQAAIESITAAATENAGLNPAQAKSAQAFTVVAADAGFDLTDNEPAGFATETRLIAALATARQLLADKKAAAVQVAAMGRAGSGAVVLKSFDRAARDQDRIYAVIDTLGPGTVLSADAASTAGYLEICGQNIEALFKGATPLGSSFSNAPQKRACALGRSDYISPDGVGTRHNASLMAGLIKTALGLYHHYIPACPAWTAPANRDLWKESPFYVPNSSRYWFRDKDRAARKAAIVLLSETAGGHLLLSESTSRPPAVGSYLPCAGPFCLPLTGNSPADLTTRLEQVELQLAQKANLPGFCKEQYREFSRNEHAPYALMLVAGTTDAMAREARFIRKMLPGSFDKLADIKTPRGSYFSARPLGSKGKVAFVYPGIGSAYVGLGQDLFHMFPTLAGQLGQLVPDVGQVLKARSLYPRTIAPLSKEQLKTLERRLRNDIMAVSECGIAFSVLYTMIMAGYFKLIPDMALGYSMGEASMMASLGVWENPGRLSRRLRENSAFRKDLHAELSAVRSSWGLEAPAAGEPDKIWESYTLFADRAVVQAEVEQADRVYLTLINTDNEVVIAGDPAACEQIAIKLGCTYFPLHLDLAIHSEPASRVYPDLVELYRLPVVKNSPIKFYSSSCYLPVPLRSKAVAHTIAKAFCDPVDFPRLVRKTWDDGARIYIETGPRQTCSLWINEILKDKPFAAVPLNIKGAGDKPALARAMAQLVGQRVKIDLGCLF